MGHTLQQRKRTTLPTIGWRSMVASVVATFAMDEADARRLEDNNAAQLIGALPFLAGCAHPERTALSHLTTLIAASRNPHVFGQKPSESIRDRLRPIETFENGDRDIIERGMTLLELASLRRAILATPACDGRRDRDHRQPLALVLISHDPDAARSALHSFGFSITVPITRGGYNPVLHNLHKRDCGLLRSRGTRSVASGRAGGHAVAR